MNTDMFSVNVSTLPISATTQFRHIHQKSRNYWFYFERISLQEFREYLAKATVEKRFNALTIEEIRLWGESFDKGRQGSLLLFNCITMSSSTTLPKPSLLSISICSYNFWWLVKLFSSKFMDLIFFFMSCFRYLEQGLQFFSIQLTVKLQRRLLTSRNQVGIVIHCTNVPWNVMHIILRMISSGQFITKKDATIYQFASSSQQLTT